MSSAAVIPKKQSLPNKRGRKPRRKVMTSENMAIVEGFFEGSTPREALVKVCRRLCPDFREGMSVTAMKKLLSSVYIHILDFVQGRDHLVQSTMQEAGILSKGEGQERRSTRALEGATGVNKNRTRRHPIEVCFGSWLFFVVPFSQCTDLRTLR
jgi:hypothetical protein